MSVPETRPDVSNDAPDMDQYAPRPLTFAENFVLTLKLLGGIGLLGTALWAVKLWTAAE